MSHRLFVRSGATVAAFALAGLAAGPAFAADPVAQATASALTLGIAGTPASTGTYAVQNDGTTQTTSGSNSPALPVVTGQSALATGTLAQDATTTISNGDGNSAACSGLAGPGATLASVGNGQSCLTGGNTLALNVASVDLSGLQIVPDDFAGGALSGLTSVLNDALSTVTSQLTGPLQTLVDALGGSPVTLGLKTIEGDCQATPTSATGSAVIAGLGLSIALPDPIGTITVPIDLGTAPNTKVLTGLDGVVDAINTALKNTLSDTLTGSTDPLVTAALAALSPVTGGVTQTIDLLNTNLIAAIAPQLAPLEENILDGTINKQTYPAANAIDVTALDVQVLPAASAFTGASLASVSIGNVTCGPNGRVATTTTTTDDDDTTTTTTSTSTPTSVTSGLGSLEDAPSGWSLAGLGGLVVAGLTAGVVGFRRSLRNS
ncbi:MAG: hypothetical protein QM572_15060 [Nocardioides sp.]|uniref:hypothetical protein n=1 Tax=Nocardioides sp. TaxID=35761 RepID=UPI0039E5F5D6